MNRTQAGEIIDKAVSAGADFAEIYIEENRRSSLSLRDQKVESATGGLDFGIGIRLLYGTEVVYGYTSNQNHDHLLSIVSDLTATRETRPAPSQSYQFKSPESEKVDHRIIKNPLDFSVEAKLSLLQTADREARGFSEQIAQVAATAVDSVKTVEIFNSENLHVEDKRIRSRFMLHVISEKDGERFTASETPGAMQGFEFFEQLDIKNLAANAAERAIRMLKAGYVKGGRMPVILGNGFGGVIFHEACGHPLETEAIRKKASPFNEKMNTQIAHSAVTAIDDGTIENSWGSLAVDDEGYPTQKTVLIENGILKNYLSDRVGSLETGVERTGSARRESYEYAPVSRMRNTYIAAGSDSFDDMLDSAENGLYASKMGGGSVNPATGEFNFAVEEGYLIEKGRITEPVRGATLIGKGHEILPLISMVGSDLQLAAGMCGASSGMVPVTVGQPTLKVDEILVGGR